MIKKILTAIAIASLASCASKKPGECATCPFTGKPLGKTPTADKAAKPE